ncbi:aminomethyl-transferring glycine dehydrogenase subunit GcvPA [Thermicanus aegyptius]|uniref:aminomethyl-transferring glycine dehydrogenase subunit GcvPA n=1 Tax=Thermicanus aegyptius TaxID=94009 RepID=UPI00049182BF|nr:aminomethyl-transferring glycine dehydrogenase subunit GcvPA [Thermicanus aegyptius]
MVHRYFPQTEEDRKEMLSFLGVESVEELFQDIPEAVRLKRTLKVGEGLSEGELMRHMRNLAGKNTDLTQLVSFLGAGVYEHYIPSVVSHLLSRSEFYTAYTPYQPEISQGELQAMFEFQTMVCEITGMEVANSSMYDGATALAEAAMMAAGDKKRKKVIISRAVHPEAREVLTAYAHGQGIQVEEVAFEEGLTSLEDLERKMDETVAAFIVQYPNFFGAVEDLSSLGEVVHRKKGVFIVSANPVSLGLLTPPGRMGADVVVGDMQPLGIPPQFGGPHCGYFAVTSTYMRKIPGRIVGETKDEKGRRGFVLTLQAREQHIRREKATSNICSNQALNAVAAAITMAALGRKGYAELARLNFQKAHYAEHLISALPGYENPFKAPFFNEFVVKTPIPVREIQERLLRHGILAGYDLGKKYPELENHLLIAVTDLRTKEEVDRFVRLLEGLQ